MTDREYRLRSRIDQLMDERDRLQEKLESLRVSNKRLATRAFELKRGRETWRLRATRRGL